MEIVPPILANVLLAGAPPLRFWKDPEFRMEDVDYGNKYRLVLVVHHPATGAALRVGERLIPHNKSNRVQAAAALIEEANKQIPEGRG